MEPKESTKEGRNKSATAIGSRRSRIWKNEGLVPYSPLAKDWLGDVYLRLTNSTSKLPESNKL